MGGMFSELQQLRDKETAAATEPQLDKTQPTPAVRPTVAPASVTTPPQPATPPPITDDQQLPAFDIREPAYQRDTFVFTEAEFDALWDMKHTLRRQYNLSRATKQNIIRVALHGIIEDFRKNKKNSFIIKRLSDSD